MLNLLSTEKDVRKGTLEDGIQAASKVESELDLRHEFFDIMKVSERVFPHKRSKCPTMSPLNYGIVTSRVR